MKSVGYTLFPKVVKCSVKEKIYVKLDGGDTAAEVKIKIQPMEQYSIPHTEKFRIDEEDRYPYAEMKAEGDGFFSTKYTFLEEQKYSVRISLGGGRPVQDSIYAVADDLAALRAFKGDTHLHTCRSDGEGTPAEVSCAYRAAGYDFIAITDHHKMPPSYEGRAAISAITKEFAVFVGEEVHNKDMGYFHVINFDGAESVNTLIETDDDYVQTELARIKRETKFDTGVDIDNCAYRIFIANEIRRRGGMAILAHPFWDAYGEYNAQVRDVKFLLRGGYYDALEVLAGCDTNGNGNNLQVALWCDLRAEGINTPIVGSSDSHSTTAPDSLFNKQFSIVFARCAEEIPEAIKSGKSVAVDRRSDTDFYCVGSFRYVKYARYLMSEYYPLYSALTKEHARQMAAALSTGAIADVGAAECAIKQFNEKFFAI